MKIFLAGLDASHLASRTNGYTQSAHVFPHVLVSFFFYVDPQSHARQSPQNIIPPVKETK
jgi:hypothetical protein